MFFQPIKTPGIAHVAYILAEDGMAALVDPGRDVERYLKVLHDNGLRLRWVLETHRQEDFEMGGAALRTLTGCEILACDHDIMAHADRRLRDRETMPLTGGMTLQALHTPGHTPESMCFAISLDAAPDRPWGVFTGDSLFIGDTGRTDLPDANKTAENAGLLYDQVHAKILSLGDQAFVLPAHGAGSACGGNVADRDHSTIGIERVSNAVATKSREDFIRHKTGEGLARPPYFRLMEEVNLQAGRPFDDLPLAWLQPEAFAELCGEALVIDTREVEAFAGGHIGGAYSVWLSGVARYGGWIAEESASILLVADSPAAAREARLSLARIGFDNVAGALAGGFEAWRDAGLPIETSGTTAPRTLADRLDEVTILDVREAGEFEEGHIPGAENAFVGHLEEQLTELERSRDAPLVVTCSVGHRGSLAASILERNGYANVSNLLGGMTAWTALNMPVEGT
ncbi:MBL fold metallo-hydrolase [Aquibaculum arenosum]|uniref:Rhodanese-like domain-containing protein n=1 Tax=Aquibaculum arenosum TaxID=3032591 RepID=A0ABT5YPY4_9PROT|nr:MBL fold metallo-hydrolase [Fodinicurvata sp. CAU 1616]MDF2096790.1 rhodanese-like domain-containing protein [Fodinicurvata sp. CAU 1616]